MCLHRLHRAFAANSKLQPAAILSEGCFYYERQKVTRNKNVVLSELLKISGVLETSFINAEFS
ncbi:MAG: hypothetical protein ACJA01_003730 [Saprospiraceae bacterium]|jgi:hypothetical protein